MTISVTRELTAELRKAQIEIEAHARSYGLDFFDVIFELVDSNELNAIAALGGFPVRYPHWRFGMEYQQLSKSYTHGLSKIYELVINNDPCYAYLMINNALVDQKLVMAHVYGHSDFFKCNKWFGRTERKMMDQMAEHASRVRRYMDRFGESEVEDFIDVCLSLDDLIDVHSQFIQRKRRDVERDDHTDRFNPTRFDAKDYLDGFVNPAAALTKEIEDREKEENAKRGRFPIRPEKDVMLFLIENAELQPWERDVLNIVRDEAYYFAPQGQTKIMNEGWASYWHSTIMCDRALCDSEVVDFADHHSGTMAMRPGSFNPYKIGIELFRDIEERWNKGRFGKDYEECSDLERKRNWDMNLNEGRQKIFEVRRDHNDITFIDTFLTEDFCRRHRLFSFAFNEHENTYEIESRQFAKVKERLLFMLTNHGRPFISVVDANFRNRRELCLHHNYLGVELKLDYAREVLKNVARIWKRPVHVETVVEKRPVLISFDGSDHTTSARELRDDEGF
jgi:stage V sporulation protein R